MSLPRIHECHAILREDRYCAPPNLDAIEENLSRLDRLRVKEHGRVTPNYELINRCDEIERWLHMNLAYGEGNVAVLIPFRESFAWGRAIYSAKQFRLASETVFASIRELPTDIDFVLTELGRRAEWTAPEASPFAHWRGRASVLDRLGDEITKYRTRDLRAANPHVRASFVEHVRAGHDVAVVAGHVGVSHATALHGRRRVSAVKAHSTHEPSLELVLRRTRNEIKNGRVPSRRSSRKSQIQEETMSQIPSHNCRNLYQPRSRFSIGPAYAQTFRNMLDAMPLAREVSIFDAKPAQAVRADATHFGVAKSDPAGLLAYMIEKWLRFALRYVTELPILLPLDTKRAWGRQIDSEEDFEFAVSDMHGIADRFLRAYQSKYTGDEALAFVASCRLARVGTDGPSWEWYDDEDMVARIVNAPTAQEVEATEPPAASDQERALLRGHFGLGFSLTEIIDHLGVAPSIAFEEFAIWQGEEQEEIERLEARDGDGA